MHLREDLTADSALGPRLRGIALVLLVSGISQTVQMGAAVPLIALWLDGHGVDATSIGLVTAAPWLAILLGSRMVPGIVARLGLQRTVLLAIALSALGLGCMSLTGAPLHLFMLNLVLGAGLVLRWVACDTWVITLSPPSHVGRAIGAHETLTGVGFMLGPLLLIAAGGPDAAPFLTCAVLIALAAPLLIPLRRWDARPAQPREPIGVLHFLRLMPIALSAAIACGVMEGAIIGLLPVYAVHEGMASKAATLAASVFGVGCTVFQIPLGHASDRLRPEKVIRACAAGLVVVAVLLPVGWSKPMLVWPLLFLLGGGVGGLFTLSVAAAVRRLGNDRLTSAVTAVAFAYTLGSVVGGPLAGFTMDFISPHGIAIVVFVTAVVLLVLGHVSGAAAARHAGVA